VRRLIAPLALARCCAPGGPWRQDLGCRGPRPWGLRWRCRRGRSHGAPQRAARSRAMIGRPVSSRGRTSIPSRSTPRSGSATPERADDDPHPCPGRAVFIVSACSIDEDTREVRRFGLDNGPTRT